MTNQDVFRNYVQAFEETYLDNDWSRLTQFFTSNALHNTGNDREVSGKDSIIAYLKESVENFDRLFDSRNPSFGELSVIGNGVVVPWVFTYKKEGAPDLVTSGTEVAEFSHAAISRLDSVFDGGVPERVQEWMGKYGNLLQSETRA